MSPRNSQNDARQMAAAFRDLQAGAAHHQAGRRDRAEALYRKVLQKVPDHPDGLHLLGVIAYENGRHQQAVRLISRAVAALPWFADAHVNLGNALWALGRLDEAAASYRAAIALKPDLALAHSHLSRLLNAQGAFGQALESARRAVELNPGLLDAHLNYAGALASERRYAEALPAFRAALGLQPDRAETLSDTATVLAELQQYEEALSLHRQAIALQPDSAEMHYRLGMALIQSGDPQAGEASCRQAIALDPGFARGWNGLGQVLVAFGRFEEARTCFYRALELDPEQAQAMAGLVDVGQSAPDEAQIERLRALFTGPNRPATIRIDAGLALGRLFDNAGRYDEAFPCFVEANALYRRQLSAAGENFDPAILRQQVDALIARCTPAFYEAVEGGSSASQVPVFVVGMPRSGTSLVEQIAASHSRVFGAGELRDIGGIVGTLEMYARDRPAAALDPDFARRLAEGYVAKLHNLAPGKDRVINKLPENILHLGMIGVLFAGARVIFCRRDPRDTALSCYFRKFNDPAPWACDLRDCAVRALELERLADHWRSALPLRMLTIDYEAVVADLEGESRRLIEFLGLDWEPACLDFHKTERPVMTSSMWQVRQPIYERSLGRWRKYEKHLGPLLEVLGEGGATG